MAALPHDDAHRLLEELAAAPDALAAADAFGAALERHDLTTADLDTELLARVQSILAERLHQWPTP